MHDLLASAAASFLKLLPVGLASRTAFVGMLLLALAGQSHISNNRLQEAVVAERLEVIQVTLEKIESGQHDNTDRLIQILEEQAKVRVELEYLKKGKNGR
jgi:hypothetical protein